MKHPSVTCIAASLAVSTLSLGIVSASAQEQTSSRAAHYLVIEASEVAEMRVVHYQQVTLAGPLVSLDDKTLAARVADMFSAHASAGTVRLRDAVGRVVYQNVVSIPRILRVEPRAAAPPDPGAKSGASAKKPAEVTPGQLVPLERLTFVVRVPVSSSATNLEIRWEPSPLDGKVRIDERARIRLIDLIEVRDDWQVIFPGPPVVTIEPVPGRQTGSPDNRVDILYVAEGYRAIDLNAFRAHTDALATGFVSDTPLLEYRGHFNQWRLHVPSSQRGADRPSCPTDPETFGQDDGTIVNTAFDATYCTDGVWRLLTVDVAKVMAAAAAYPNWDQLVVVVNSSIYGGAGGGGASVTSLGSMGTIDAETIGVMLHEFGHQFGRLADEYVDAYVNPIACSDTNAAANDNCQANVTDETDRTRIKWRRWIDAATPIPTAGPLMSAKAAGLWEGARYVAFGMFRQCYDGRMRESTFPFCDADGEQLLLRLYNGVWGQPTNGISMIEPGTRLPVDSSPNVRNLDTIRLQAQVLGPQSGPNVRVQWFVNNQLEADTTMPSGSNATFDFFGEVFDSTNVITLKVTDESPLLHSTMRSASVSDTSWTVKVIGPCRVDCPTGSPNTP